MHICLARRPEHFAQLQVRRRDAAHNSQSARAGELDCVSASRPKFVHIATSGNEDSLMMIGRSRNVGASLAQRFSFLTRSLMVGRRVTGGATQSSSRRLFSRISRALIPAIAVAALLFVPEAIPICAVVFERLRNVLNTVPPHPTVLQRWSSTPRARRMVPIKTTIVSTFPEPARAASPPSAVSAPPSAAPLAPSTSPRPLMPVSSK